MSGHDAAAFLRASPVFAALPPKEIDALAALAREENCRTRDYVFMEGGPTYLLNTILTVRGLARWTFTARLVLVALAGLALTMLAGLALGVQRLRPFVPGEVFPNLHAHVQLALLGRVLPMSSASPPASTRCSCSRGSRTAGPGSSSSGAS